jgi:hypothetical protein
MAKIHNHMLRPYDINISYQTAGGALQVKNIRCVPGKKTELSLEELKAAKKNKGFLRRLEAREISIVDEKKTEADNTIDADEVKIAKSVRDLAEKNNVDLTKIEPNAKNSITKAMVQAVIDNREEDDSNGENDNGIDDALEL